MVGGPQLSTPVHPDTTMHITHRVATASSPSPAPGRLRQRGMGLFSLMFWLVLIGGSTLIVLKVFPTVNEYLTIQKAVDKIGASGLSTAPEIRNAFEATKAIEYSITSISSKDLVITKEGDKTVIRYAYNVEIELFSPVYLLMKYEGRSK
jgi:Domain of unknown function (DUF4845)